MGLRRALIGLAIPMASEGTAKRLCLAGYERIEDVVAATAEDLVAIREDHRSLDACRIEHRDGIPDEA
ncbi:hypothetical protein BS35_008147 [Actinomadura glauciflava]|uniref:hypothetical protein n=1 Tax=Actinomadura luteofluorescens TaxID=46163 RepID=UPI00216451B3|nr:hypothetical protein [Actinomadura glauciflava]MCR3745550.1 hypothetical protein [Actinomadura glauciflava]